MENDEDKGLEKLSKILTKIKDLYYKKQEQVEQLENELSDLRDIINYLNSVISDKSFTTADEFYQKSLRGVNKEQVKKMAKNLFNNDVLAENVKDTTIKRKIFSNKDDSLLCVLKFIDFNEISITFTDPERINIREASEDFINIFLKGALLEIVEKTPNLEKRYHNFNDTDIIERIEITNLKNLEEYDLITEKITELLYLQVSKEFDRNS